MDIKIDHVFSLADLGQDTDGTQNTFHDASMTNECVVNNANDVTHGDTVDGEIPLQISKQETPDDVANMAPIPAENHWFPDIRGDDFIRDKSFDSGSEVLNESTDSAYSDAPPFLSCEATFDSSYISSASADSDVPPSLSCEETFYRSYMLPVSQDMAQDAWDPPVLEPVHTDPTTADAMMFEDKPFRIDDVPRRKSTRIDPCYIVLTDISPALKCKESISIRKFRRTYRECLNICKKIHFKRQLRAGRDVFNVKAPSKQKEYQYFLWKEENKRQMAIQFAKSKSRSQPFTVLKELLKKQALNAKKRSKTGARTGVGRITRVVTRVPKDFIKEFKGEAEREKKRLLAEKELWAEERQRILHEQNLEKKLKKELNALRAQVKFKRQKNQCVKRIRQCEKNVPSYMKAGVTSFSGRQRKVNQRYSTDYVRTGSEVMSYRMSAKVEAMLKNEGKKRTVIEKVPSGSPAQMLVHCESSSDITSGKAYKRKRIDAIQKNCGLKRALEQTLKKRQENKRLKKKMKEMSLISSKDKILIQDMPTEEHVINDFLQEDGSEFGSKFGASAAFLDVEDRYTYAKALLKGSLDKQLPPVKHKQKTLKKFSQVHQAFPTDDTSRVDRETATVTATTPIDTIDYSKADAEKNKKFKIPETVQKLFKKSHVKTEPDADNISGTADRSDTILNEKNVFTRLPQDTVRYIKMSDNGYKSILVRQPGCKPVQANVPVIATPHEIVDKQRPVPTSILGKHVPFTMSVPASSRVASVASVATLNKDTVPSVSHEGQKQFIQSKHQQSKPPTLLKGSACTERNAETDFKSATSAPSAAFDGNSSAMNPVIVGRTQIFPGHKVIVQDPALKYVSPLSIANALITKDKTTTTLANEKLNLPTASQSSASVLIMSPPVDFTSSLSGHGSNSNLSSSVPVSKRESGRASTSVGVLDSQTGVSLLESAAVSLAKKVCSNVNDQPSRDSNIPKEKAKFALIKLPGKTLIVPVPIVSQVLPSSPVYTIIPPSVVPTSVVPASAGSSTAIQASEAPVSSSSHVVDAVPALSSEVKHATQYSLSIGYDAHNQLSAVANPVSTSETKVTSSVNAQQPIFGISPKSLESDTVPIQTPPVPKSTQTLKPVLLSGFGTKQAFTTIHSPVKDTATKPKVITVQRAHHSQSSGPISIVATGKPNMFPYALMTKNDLILTVRDSGSGVSSSTASVDSSSDRSRLGMSVGHSSTCNTVPNTSLPLSTVIKQEPIDPDEPSAGTPRYHKLILPNPALKAYSPLSIDNVLIAKSNMLSTPASRKLNTSQTSASGETAAVSPAKESFYEDTAGSTSEVILRRMGSVATIERTKKTPNVDRVVTVREVHGRTTGSGATIDRKRKSANLDTVASTSGRETGPGAIAERNKELAKIPKLKTLLGIAHPVSEKGGSVVSSEIKECEQTSSQKSGKETEPEKPKAFSESLSDRGERLRRLKALLKEKQQAVESIRLSTKKITDSVND